MPSRSAFDHTDHPSIKVHYLLGVDHGPFDCNASVSLVESSQDSELSDVRQRFLQNLDLTLLHSLIPGLHEIAKGLSTRLRFPNKLSKCFNLESGLVSVALWNKCAAEPSKEILNKTF